MHSDSNPIPGFRAIYWSDFTIRRSFNAVFFLLFVCGGVIWATQPQPNALPSNDPVFDAAVRKWVPRAALAASAISGLIFARRYLLVRKILGEGTRIRGTVEDLIVYGWRSESASGRPGTANNQHAYWAVIRYAVHGVEKKIKFKLLHSGYTYGMKKGGETDLMVLDSAPQEPLLCAVYLGSVSARPMKWLW